MGWRRIGGRRLGHILQGNMAVGEALMIKDRLGNQKSVKIQK